MPTGDVVALNSSRESTASTSSGYPILLLMLAVAAVGAFLIYRGFDMHSPVLIGNAAWIGGLLILFLACGFYMLQPNQAAAITLFGDYRGTDRSTGLRWVLPWMIRKKVSVRANNFISERIKVNDLRGNPIEMAAQIVWRVVDTAQALFDVDDYKEFVKVQVEAAIRAIGSRYPYDDFEHLEVTLRGNHDEVGVELRNELKAQAVGRGDHRRRMRLHSPRLCAGDRRRDASPAAGAGGGRGAQDAGRRRGRNGRDGARAIVARRTSSISTTSGARRWSRT